MKTIFRTAFAAVLLAAGVCLTACGRNNNLDEGAADPVEKNQGTSTDSVDAGDAGFVNDSITE